MLNLISPQRFSFFVPVFLFSLCCSAFNAQAESTLQRVQATRSLNCGINVEEAEYTMKDAHGNRSLLDRDFCKAVAVAVLGPQAKFVVKVYRDEASSLTALQKSEIDVLASASANFRTTNGSFSLARPIFYDSQGFLVNTGSNIHSARDFAGKKVCFLIGTEIQTQVDSFMARQKIKYIPGPFSEEGEMEAAFVTGTCAAVTADVSQLAYERLAFKKMAAKFQILPDVVAIDPLAPAVRTGDSQWLAIVDWTEQALIQAEEFGISQSNLLSMKECGDIRVQRLLGSNHGWGQFLGLDDAWAARVIEATGNYGEMFRRDLGSNSPMGLERRMNSLWTEGGLMLAYPIR